MLSTFSVAHLCMVLELTIWHWVTRSWAHSWGRLTLHLFLSIPNCLYLFIQVVDSVGVFPNTLAYPLMLPLCKSCLGDHIFVFSWRRQIHTAHPPILATSLLSLL